MPELNQSLFCQKNCISLSRKDEIFEVLLEASEDLIFILDNKGCFKRVNENGAALLEFSSQELLGKHLLEFVDPNSNRVIASSLQEILESNELTTFETVLVSKQFLIRVLNPNCWPLLKILQVCIMRPNVQTTWQSN